MLKSLGRAMRTFGRAIDTANAIRHGLPPKHYDDVREPVLAFPIEETDELATSRSVAA